MSKGDYSCYVIYSPSLDRYYIGYTENIEERINLHNTGHFGGQSFTHRASDWMLYFLIPCTSINQAVYIESRIKKMKSKIYIENLKKYPEMVEKLLKSYID